MASPLENVLYLKSIWTKNNIDGEIMGETRVNLAHWLEDLRDSYPFSQEEVIITELVANALDSDASKIQFFTDLEQGALSVVDDGKGMTSKELEAYHDIAETTKIRGKGIGFAGLGAKLALLVAKEVLTETKRDAEHIATRWNLEGSRRAPWEYVKPKGLVGSSTGTAVSIFLHDKGSGLLSDSFIEHVIQTHFYPILNEEFMSKILKYVYKKGITFEINGRRIGLMETSKVSRSEFFWIKLGRQGNPVGVGFLSKSERALPEEQQGVAVSTFGKVIKRGWDWIGLIPRNPTHLTGVIEIPKLSEILTTNKTDFLKDAVSLQKYYRYRKAIQEAMEPVLKKYGELGTPRKKPERDLEPLEKEIEQVLKNMLDDFPELTPLFGRKGKGEPEKGIVLNQDGPLIGKFGEGVDRITGTRGGSGQGSGIDAAEGKNPGERIKPDLMPTESGQEHEGRRRLPGIMISFEDNPQREECGWLIENTIYINTGHPAYQRVKDSEAENYHIVLSVSWVLSNYLEGEKSPQKFINAFLSSWGSRK